MAPRKVVEEMMRVSHICAVRPQQARVARAWRLRLDAPMKQALGRDGRALCALEDVELAVLWTGPQRRSEISRLGERLSSRVNGTKKCAKLEHAGAAQRLDDAGAVRSELWRKRKQRAAGCRQGAGRRVAVNLRDQARLGAIGGCSRAGYQDNVVAHKYCGAHAMATTRLRNDSPWMEKSPTVLVLLRENAPGQGRAL